MKKVTSFLLLVPLLLVVSCGGGPKPPTVEEETAKITVESSNVTQTSICVNVAYSGDRDISSWDISLYDSVDDALVEKAENISPENAGHFFMGLQTNHEYTAKVTAHFLDEPYNIIVSKQFKTTEFVAPEIKSEFTSSFKNNYSETIENRVKIFWEQLNGSADKVELLRASTKDGDYTVITSDSGVLLKYLYDKTVNPETTYFYKVRFYTLVSGEYKLAAESEILEVKTGKQLPSAIAKADISFIRGITTLKYSWPAVEGATKYNISLGTSSYSHTDDQKFETEENSYFFKGLSPNQNYYFTISVTTSAGTSLVTEAYQATTGSTTITYNGVTVDPQQTQAVYKVSLPFTDTTDCTVSFVLRKTSDETSDVIMEIPELVNNSFIRTNLQPATWYSDYNNNYAGYLHMSVTYKDENGQQKTENSYTNVKSFTTDDLVPPKNLKIDAVTKTTATLTFDELTTEEKLGKTPEYSISVYSSDGKYVKTGRGNSSPITIEGLKAGSEYTFKARASFDNASSTAEYDTTEIMGNTTSGINEKPVITLSEEPFDDEVLKEVWSNIKVEWNALSAAEGLDPEKLVYGIEYKIFEYSKYKRPQTTAKVDETYTGTTSFSEKIEFVNGGNRYTVRVYAFDSDEPDDIVYSDPVKIQLKAISDRSMYAAMTYNADFASHVGASEGDIVDFANKKVWEDEHSIRSTDSAYNVGYIQLFGEVDETKYLFPKKDGLEYCSFKINLTDALDNATVVPRIILIDRSSFSFQGSTYSYFDNVYYIVPNEQGTIVKEFSRLGESSIYKDFNMPFFYEGSTSTPPKNAGRPIDESYIFNNCVYMGVKQTQAGDIGFSYYY